MLSKKEILRHAFWGGVFGLISGVAISYGDKHGSLYDLIYYWSGGFYSKTNSTQFLPKPFPEPVQLALFFLLPGLLLACGLGIAGKSFKKLLYAILGALVGSGIYYLLAQLGRNVMPKEFFFLISPIIYSLTTGFTLSLFYKSFKKGFKGCAGGIICWLGVGIIALYLNFSAGLAVWGALDIYVRDNILNYILMGTIVTIGIAVGSEYWIEE